MEACKWCGAPASGPSPSRAVWAVAAVAALAVGVLLGWWVWRTRTPSMADVMGVPVRVARPSPSVRTTLDSSRSENVRVVALPAHDAKLTAPSRVLAHAPSGALSPTSPATLALAAVPASGVETWRAAVANAYANLRADARFDARIVGVLSPNQRLQVGEVVKGWRRVNTGAAEGWADAKYLTVR
ncbi:MAG: SH3 domain-containing protein [Gemmatimonadaceae bacterium]|nr:SH3 domain-containing protein [Gemmatimonadaceae bacterium]